MNIKKRDVSLIPQEAANEPGQAACVRGLGIARLGAWMQDVAARPARPDALKLRASAACDTGNAAPITDQHSAPSPEVDLILLPTNLLDSPFPHYQPSLRLSQHLFQPVKMPRRSPTHALADQTGRWDGMASSRQHGALVSKETCRLDRQHPKSS